MNASPTSETETTHAEKVLVAPAGLLWRVLRLPLLLVLTLLEPVVRIVFSVAMVLGVIASIVFEISAVGPRFPFFGMLALSLGFGLALILYYGLLGLVSD